jgi:hypothetical protein
VRAVLTRNGQPVAALQSQGRLLNNWIEIIYDARGYRVSQVVDRPGNYALTDREGQELLSVERDTLCQIKLYRALPLPLLVMVVMQTINETVPATAAVRTVETVS